MKGTLHEDQCTFFIISRTLLLIMRNVSNSCRENQITHFVFSSCFPKNRAVYENVKKNIVETARLQMTMRGVRIACWMSKEHTHNM